MQGCNARVRPQTDRLPGVHCMHADDFRLMYDVAGWPALLLHLL
jgi:hypothetical protein